MSIPRATMLEIEINSDESISEQIVRWSTEHYDEIQEKFLIYGNLYIKIKEVNDKEEIREGNCQYK